MREGAAGGGVSLAATLPGASVTGDCAAAGTAGIGAGGIVAEVTGVAVTGVGTTDGGVTGLGADALVAGDGGEVTSPAGGSPEIGAGGMVTGASAGAGAPWLAVVAGMLILAADGCAVVGAVTLLAGFAGGVAPSRMVANGPRPGWGSRECLRAGAAGGAGVLPLAGEALAGAGGGSASARACDHAAGLAGWREAGWGEVVWLEAGVVDTAGLAGMAGGVAEMFIPFPPWR
ncbi:hypothetical protein [Acidocella aquatica]|uniref:hypothetical protein n=1 Tax=Acidocella aquatica TaxID=1922313 RepID=UPI0024E1802B|nr:hypothetical protein [Acidocella aquatica]